MYNIQLENHFTENVANVSFIFGTSQNIKPEEKKWRDVAYYIPNLKNWGGTLPRIPHQITPMVPRNYKQSVVLTAVVHFHSFRKYFKQPDQINCLIV